MCCFSPDMFKICLGDFQNLTKNLNTRNFSWGSLIRIYFQNHTLSHYSLPEALASLKITTLHYTRTYSLQVFYENVWGNPDRASSSLLKLCYFSVSPLSAQFSTSLTHVAPAAEHGTTGVILTEEQQGNCHLCLTMHQCYTSKTAYTSAATAFLSNSAYPKRANL